jgi:regulator of telomere elongation helicase 1
MPLYEIEGVPIQFPYEAYECQLAYMKKVILALQSNQNALLESPTGTGKTLCLLCAVLAWRQALVARRQAIVLKDGSDLNSTATSHRSLNAAVVGKESNDEFERLPQIIYSSRTHSQLTQAVGELKKISYTPRVAVLASREQCCINPEISKLASNPAHHNAMCKKAIVKKTCQFYAATERVAENLPQGLIMDIEDMNNWGTQHKACPYFLGRASLAKADISFMPYNYLFDARIRKSQGLEISNSIVIVDEGHNVEGVCCDSSSFDLDVNTLDQCVLECEIVINLIEKMQYESERFGKEYFVFLAKFCRALKDRIQRIPIGATNTWNGDFIFTLFSSQGDDSTLAVSCESARGLAELCDEGAHVMLSETKAKSSNFSKLSECLRLVFRSEYEIDESLRAKYAAFYRVQISESLKNNSRILSYWCFNPGVILYEMKKIMQVRNLILTSGTLSPLDSLAADLQIEFNQRLENDHVITPSQLMIGVLSKGPSGGTLNSSWAQRSSDKYRSELGNAIVQAAKRIPNGILVFFPSYSLMESCLDWFRVGEPQIWSALNVAKKVFLEPKDKSTFQSTISAYLQESTKGRSGAIMFGVCRGKISEGIDFRDERARAVIITGIPFACLKEPKIILKKQYLDKQRIKNFNGNDWYVQQASRALNQAIGRVIRHVEDYGMVLLFDERFTQSQNIAQLSRWLRPYLKVHQDWNECEKSIQTFFNNSLSRKKRTLAAQEVKSPICEPLISQVELIPAKPVSLPCVGPKETLKKFCSLFAGAGPSINAVNPMPPPMTPAERMQKTKEYVESVRKALNPQQYKEFSLIFTQYSKSPATGIPELLEKIATFLVKCDKFELFESFGVLVQQKFLPDWRKLKDRISKLN